MNIGILLWNTCNAECEHCAVSSGPREKPIMSDEEIFRIIDSAFYDGRAPNIGLSGGEAFFYFSRLRNIVSYATKKGARVAVNSNGFWGAKESKAFDYVEKLKSDGLDKLVLSTDDYHRPYVAEDCIVNVIQACLHYHLEVDVQFVTSRTSTKLHDFLARNHDGLLNISVREIPVHPVGRARDFIIPADYLIKKNRPKGLCPSAIPSVSAAGKLIPCCNTAGHLSALELGDAREIDLPNAFEEFKSNPLFQVLRSRGPAALLEAAGDCGYKDGAGYVDQCHLCYEMFKEKDIANNLKIVAEKMKGEELYTDFKNQYLRALSHSVS